MKPGLVCAFLFLAVGVVGTAYEEASAVPVFARKYGANCTMCHSNMPRLNDFGARYRANGYRLPGREKEERTVLDSPSPVAFRASAGYVGVKHSAEVRAADLSDFRLNGLDLLSAGLVGRNIGYFVGYTPHMAEARGVAGQVGRLEMANVVFSDLGRSSWLNLRVGRFEPAYVAFSVKRQLAMVPYEIYDVTFPGGPPFSETQSGLELTGHGRSPLGYAAGIVQGSSTNSTTHSSWDVYGRAQYVLGQGEGQTAGHRLGVTGYAGRSRPEAGEGMSPKSFYRFGADASLNAPRLNLALQWMYGVDDSTHWRPGAMSGQVTWWGGFGELTVMPAVFLAAFARVDLVKLPKEFEQDITRLTAGGRYYFEDNIAWHTAVSYRVLQSRTANAKDSRSAFLTTQIDFAF